MDCRIDTRSNNLREICIRLNISPDDLYAKICKENNKEVVSSSLLTLMHRGTWNAHNKPEIRNAIAKALGCPIDEIFPSSEWRHTDSTWNK